MGSRTGFDRRDFLRGLGTSLAATSLAAVPSARAEFDRVPRVHAPEELLGALREGLQAPPVPSAPAGSEAFWREVRRAFVLSDRYIHLNTGTTGSQPRFSLSNLAIYNLYKSLDPRDWERNLNERYPELFPLAPNAAGTPSAIVARQQAVAALYGANPDEIVLSYNTTDALNLVFAGTPWKSGDRIITTHWEHPALRGPTAWARDQFGVEVRELGLPSKFEASITKDDVLSWFEDELARPLPSGAKQYLAVSEIFYKNGLRLPVAELSELAHAYGAYTIIDSAHGFGQLAIDAHAYGADFLAGAGHKWLGGGPGTGIFYVRNSGSDLAPFKLGNFYQYASVDTRERGFSPAASIQARGELNTPALLALSDSAAFFGKLGTRAVQERGFALASHLRARITERWGRDALWVQESEEPAFRTALVSFNPFRGRDDTSQFQALSSAATAVLNRLAAEQPKIYVRTVTWKDRPSDPSDNRVGFRISTHGVYNRRLELDYALERLARAVDASGIAQLS